MYKGAGGRASHTLIVGFADQSPAPPTHMSKCPWPRHPKLLLVTRSVPCMVARCHRRVNR